MMTILLWSLRTTAVTALSGVLLVLLRRRSAAQRNLVLRIAVTVAWLLPLAAFVAPRIEVPQTSLVRTFPSVAAAAPVVDAFRPAPSETRLGTSPGSPSFSTSSPPAPAPSRPFPWALAYCVGVGIVLLRWTGGMIRLGRLRRAAAPTGDPMVWRAAVPIPATYGRTILVPKGSDDWPQPRIQAAILHERAHIRRGDWLWQTFAGGLAAAHWFNPLVWVLVRSMRDTSEAATDDAVLADGLAPSAYARELIALAAMATSVGPALAMARRGGVRDRVAAILAVSQDRRTPTRRATVLLAGMITVSGVAVAGLVEKVAAPEKSNVSLVDIRQLSPLPSARWNAEGLPVATPDEVAQDSGPASLGYAPRDKRRVSARIAVQGYVEADQVRIWVEKPASVVSYGSPHGNGQPSEGQNDGALEVDLDAPLNAALARIRVGRASGAYQAYAGKIPFTAKSEPISWPEGTFPGAKIDFAFPKALANLDYRVFVLTDKGRVEVRSNEYEYTDDGDGVPRTVYIAVDDPAHVRGVGIETRAYKMTTLDLPLIPKAPLPPPIRTEPKHTIDLVRLSQGDRSWLPDGALAKPLGTIASRNPAGPDERKLTLAFRVRGESWFNPSLAPNLGDRYATGGDWSGFLGAPGKPDERIGIVTLNVPKTATLSPVTVVLRTTPWQVHADQLAGPKAGQAHLVRLRDERGADGQMWTTYSVSLDGVAPIGAGRDLDLILLDGNDRRIASMVEHRPTSQAPSYTVIVPSGASIRRVILQSQAFERARFEDVHLTPNS